MCLGIPGQVIAVDDAERRQATVNVGGVQRVVNLACVVEDAAEMKAAVGTWVLVHVGFALSRIDEDEAYQTLKLLSALGELAEHADTATSAG